MVIDPSNKKLFIMVLSRIAEDSFRLLENLIKKFYSKLKIFFKNKITIKQAPK